MWPSWIQYHTDIFINRRVHPHGFWLSRPQKGSRLGRKQINTVMPLQPGPFRNQMTDKSPKFRLQITPQNSSKKKKKKFCKGKYIHEPDWTSPQSHWFSSASHPVSQGSTWGLCWEAAPAKRTLLRPKLSPFLQFQYRVSAPNAQNFENKMQRWVQS